MQADAYAGFNPLYEGARKPGPIVEATCWAHGRRKFYELAEVAESPIVIEAVQHIDAIFAIEREIKGMTAGCAAHRPPGAGKTARRRSPRLYARTARVSGKPPGKARDYMLKCWDAFARFLKRKDALVVEVVEFAG